MKYIICIAAIMASLTGYAEDKKEPTQEELNLVEEFFEASRSKEKYEKGLTAGFDSSMAMTDMPGMTEDQRARFEDMQEKIKNLMLEEMGWEKVKDDYIELYLSVYTAKELKAVVKLLKTPVAQKMLEKEIKLLPKAMLLGQKHAKKLQPRIMQISMEAMQP